MQEQLTIVKELNQSKKVGLEETSKNFQDLKYSNQRELHEVEKRLTFFFIHDCFVMISVFCISYTL